MGVMLRWWAVMVAVTLLAAACGGDGGGSDGEAVAGEPVEAADDAAGSEASGEDVPSGPIASPDGRLVVTPPGGAGPITVDPGEPIEALDGLGVSVAAYELGPDGSVFDEPVELRFAVDEATATSGVVVTAQSSDGTLDALSVTLERTDDGYDVVALLDHFTRVELRSGVATPVAVLDPTTFSVGHDFVADLQAVVGADVVPGVVSDVAVELRGIPEQAWTPAGPIEAVAGSDDTFVCRTPGGGLVAVTGLMRIEVLGSPGGASPQPLTWSTEVPLVDLEVGVDCSAPATELTVLDMRCINRQTGEASDGCAYPDTVTISNPEAPEIRVEGATMTDADFDAVLSIYTGMTLVECNLDGCNTFTFPSFGGRTTDWDLIVTPVGEGMVDFGQVPFTGGPDGVVVEVPPGVDMIDGTELVGGPELLEELVVFVQVGDIQSTTLLDVGDVQAFFDGP